MKNHRRALKARISELNRLRDQKEQEFAQTNSSYFRGFLRSEHPYSGYETHDFEDQVAYFLASNSERARQLTVAARDLPDATTQRWHQRSNLQVGLISDESDFQRLEPTAHFTRLTPESAEHLVTSLDFLLIVLSSHELTTKEERGVRRLVSAAQKDNKPVVLYISGGNAPAHTSVVRSATAVVATSDQCTVGHQTDTCTCITVPLGINPLRHNPLGSMRERSLEYFLTDNWLDTEPKVRDAAERILDGLLSAPAPLVLTDQFGDHRLASRYLPSLYPGLSKDDPLFDRLFTAGIALNADTGSQTQYSSRVLELQAAGSMVISTYNAGVNSEFAHVVMPDSRLDSRSFALAQTTASIRRSQVEGVRAAFTKRTVFDTFTQVISAAGLADDALPTRRVHIVAKSQEDFETFKQSQLVECELTYLPHDQLGHVTGQAAGDIAVNIDWTRDHSPHLVQDLLNGFKFADVDMIAAVDPLVSSNAVLPYEFTDRPDKFDVNTAYWVPAETTVMQAIETAKVGATVAHTFPLERQNARSRTEPKLSVVVPVYNNGRHLRDKCVASLQRSSIFADMQILLIDDGSTDLETKYIIEQLKNEHDNVEVFAFEPGGSGSASRPRNKGLELARGTFITYLDPDNEATNDGYAVLSKLVEEDDLDFAIGDIIMLRKHRNVIRNSDILIPWIDLAHNLDDRALELTNFQPMSIQALVARTSWLRGLGLVQPVGAVGQDSYFFQQMLYYAKRVRAIPLSIHTYYAAVSGSTVNNVSANFFKKYLPLERARTEWLRSVGLLEAYNRRRLERFTKAWYLDKLGLVRPDERAEATATLRELIAMFGHSDWQDPALRKFFIGR